MREVIRLDLRVGAEAGEWTAALAIARRFGTDYAGRKPGYVSYVDNGRTYWVYRTTVGTIVVCGPIVNGDRV